MDETYWDSLLDLIKKGSDGDTIMVPNNDSKFFIYDAMDDLKTAGTLVEYKGKKRARKVYRALHHAKETDEHFLLPVRFIADKYWVFPMRLISWGDWLSVLRKDPPALGEVPKIVSSVWRQITKVVKKNCFAKVSDSFGITRDNKVYYYAPPGSKTDFHTNLTDLSDMADDLIGCLRLLKNRFQVSSLNATTDRFVDFRDFVRVTYLNCLRREGDQLSAGTRFQLQLFCLHHPASFDDAGFLRFFNNLGLIGDRDEPTNLGNQAEFRDHIWDTLNDWRQTVSVDEQLKGVLFHSINQEPEGDQQRKPKPKYHIRDLPAFCLNAMKHYRQHAPRDNVSARRTTRSQVICRLCDLIPNLTEIMYMGYMMAVIRNKYIDPYDPVVILTEDT